MAAPHAVMASDQMMFHWYLGDLESFWSGMPRVYTPSLHLTGAWSSKQWVLFAAKADSLKEEIYSDLSHCYGVFWCLWAAVIDFCEGVGEEVEIPDQRGEGGYIPHPTSIHGCPAGQCNLHLGRLGQSALYLNFRVCFVL